MNNFFRGEGKVTIYSVIFAAVFLAFNFCSQQAQQLVSASHSHREKKNKKLPSPCWEFYFLFILKRSNPLGLSNSYMWNGDSNPHLIATFMGKSG